MILSLSLYLSAELDDTCAENGGTIERKDSERPKYGFMVIPWNVQGGNLRQGKPNDMRNVLDLTRLVYRYISCVNKSTELNTPPWKRLLVYRFSANDSSASSGGVSLESSEGLFGTEYQATVYR